MNKLMATIVTGFVLISQNPAPAYAAPANHSEPAVRAAAAPTPNLTLNQIVSQNLSTDGLAAPVVQVQAPAPVLTPQQLAEQLVTAHYGAGQYAAFAKIVARESSWNPSAVNQQTGACGLGQALPCSKIADHSVEGQLDWMISYIDQRYGTPAAAWHAEQTKGWY